MDTGLPHLKMLGFQLARFSSFLLRVVLGELFRQGIWIFHMPVFQWLTQLFLRDSSPVYELFLYHTIAVV